MADISVGFVVAGTQKGGTSALDAYLRGHPQLGMAKQKEVHFFDTEEYFSGDAADYALYHASFQYVEGVRLFGEVTPAYMYWHDAPKRIWRYNPHMKLLVILRDPIKRAFSQWNMQRLWGVDRLSFSDAIRSEPQRAREALPLQHRFYSYLDRGFYSEQIRRLWRFFPKEQTLFLKSEDLHCHHQPTLNRVWRFLGVDEIVVGEAKIVHAHPYDEPMREEDFTFLSRVFKHDIKHVEALLNWDCGDWLTRCDVRELRIDRYVDPRA